MRAAIYLASVVVGSSLFACAALSDETAREEAAHTEGRPTYAQYAWLWADETLDEFKANAAAGSFWESPEFLPIDHPMAQRLQFWLDQMDAALRAKTPEALASTPKPQIILRKDPSPNAWVTYLPVAWKVRTRLLRDASAAPDAGAEAADADAQDAALPAPPPSTDVLLLTRTGTIKLLGDSKPLAREFDEKRVAEFVKFHNDGFAKCRLSIDSGAIVFGNGCAVDSEIGPLDRSDRVAYYATAKWITVTTGLVTSMLDEDRILAVLAHELGHYYRTHAAQPSDQLNYFYALGDDNAKAKPAPDPRYLEQTLKARDKLRSTDWFVDYGEENKLMTDQRLGFYTTEQEADELSLELLAKIGMPPTLGVDSQAQLHKIIDDMSGGFGRDTGDIKWEQCSMLRAKDFKDETGATVSVPVGDLSDPHHSWCFRVFNLTRELAAHDYQIAGERPRAPGDSFARLVMKMQADLDAPPPPPDAGEPDAAPADAGEDR